MRDGFKPVVRAELPIDVMEVISESLRTNVEVAYDVGRSLPL
jgi:hypothetical protein